MVVEKGETMTQLLDRSLFTEAQSKFKLAIDRCYVAAEQMRESQSRQRDAKEAVDFEEARVRLDPNTEWGKNAEERTAQLKLNLAEDDDYNASRKELETAISETQRWQDEMQRARDEMSLYRRLMDWAIVQAKFLTEDGINDN